MKAYLFSLIFLSFLSSALLFFLKNSKYEGHLRFVCSLVMLLTLAGGAFRLLSDGLPPLFKEIGYEEKAYDTTAYAERLKTTTAEALENELSAAVKAKTELTDEDYRVIISITQDGTIFTLSKITCRLYSVNAVLHREEIRKILETAGENIEFIEEIANEKK